MTTPTKVRVYLDLDGVMADFDAHFPEVFGRSQKDISDDLMWDMINSHPNYFLNMPLCPGALEFMQFLKALDIEPIILTACPKSNYEHVAKQKRQWVDNNLGFHLTVLPVMGGKNKYLFMHAKGDILIDDMPRNCKYWVDAGGHAIVHGDFADTRDILFERLLASKYPLKHLQNATRHVSANLRGQGISEARVLDLHPQLRGQGDLRHP